MRTSLHLIGTGRVRSSRTFSLDLLLSEPDPHGEGEGLMEAGGSPFWRDEEAPPPLAVACARQIREG